MPEIPVATGFLIVARVFNPPPRMRTKSSLHGRKWLCYWACLAAIFISSPLRAQTTAPPADTTATKLKQIRPGLELPDSLYIARDSIKGDIDTIVRYTAKDSTVFDIPRKRMTLVNNSIVEFENRELDAYTIVMDFQSNTLTAYSYNVDSVIASSIAFQRRIIRDTSRTKARGAPKLNEGGTIYEGEVIVYNFKRKQGTVQLGTTEMEGGFYYGEKIKQVAPKTLFVENGRYTTCDEPTPHYYFASPEMKVVMGEQIFAAPVYLYVADVPIFALPFGVFPNHGGGRHSGIIPPSYQTQGGRGYGLTHLGYYEVWSDYFDSRIQSDIYTVGGYNIDFQTEWMKRYLLNSAASIEVGYGKTRFSSGDPFQKNWLGNLQLPNLQLGYQTALSANLSFQSNGYFQNTAQNQQQFFTQQVTSNAAFSTNWPDAGVSLGINYSRSQSLLNGTYQESSPQINLSKTTWFPFQSSDGSNTNPTLSSFGIGYTFTGSHNLNKVQNINGADTTYNTQESYSMLHSPSISISPKLGYFTITPSVGLADAWLVREHNLSNGRKVYIRDTAGKIIDSVAEYDTTTTHNFRNLFNYNAAVSISTTLYGTANIGAFGIQAVRHTIQPRIGLVYQPDLSSQNYQQILNPATGQFDHYNIFNGEPNSTIVGPGKAATMTIDLANNFEAKVERQVTKDSTTVDHVKLFNLDAGTGYNLVSKLLTPLALNASSSIGTLFTLSGNASFSFYPANYLGIDSTPFTLISLHQFFIRPQTVQASLSGNFSASTTIEGNENYDSLRRLFNITSPEDERALFLGGYYPGQYIDVPFHPKWQINYGLSYQETYSATGAPQHFFGANVAISLPLTVNWMFTATATYDPIAGKIVDPQLTVHRDLHCWEMNFSYRPPGSAISGFNLEIRIKAPQLQDIKLTRTENTYGEF